MAGFDSLFILKTTAILTHNITDQVPGKRESATGLQEARAKVAATLAPGIVAFLGRLSATLPGENDRLLPIVEAFFAAPATAAAIVRLSGGDMSAVNDLAGLFLAAGQGNVPISRSDFEDALAEFVAAMQESVYRDLRRPAGFKWITSLYQQLCPVALSSQSEPYHEAARYLLEALQTAGISAIRDGQAIAADGVTVIFIWQGRLTSAAPDEPQEQMEEIGPEPANGGSGSEPPPMPPMPPMPPEPETGEQPVHGVDLRLDAALPQHVTVGLEFVVAVSIRRPSSPVLAPADLARQESADFAVLWPDNAPFVSLRIAVKATGCDVVGSDSEPVRLLAGRDSAPVYFQLVPRQTGPIQVFITVYQETEWIGSSRVVTDAVAVEPRGELAISVNSQPVGNGESNLQLLSRALDDGYNLEELRGLCFELGIDFEDIPGATQSAKAYELVLYAQRHGLTARLVDKVIKDRPHLLVPA